MRNRPVFISAMLLATLAIAAIELALWNSRRTPPTQPPCSMAWANEVENQLNLADFDGHGHGPDVGTHEWYNAVFRWVDLPRNLPEAKACQKMQQRLENRYQRWWFPWG